MSEHEIHTRFGRVRTDYWPKPIPLRTCDWTAWIDGDEEKGEYGYGATEAEAYADLISLLEELEEETISIPAVAESPRGLP